MRLASSELAFRRKLSRARLLPFLAEYPACLVAMEACASAHYWGREIGRPGHDVRLIAPQYVKPFVAHSAIEGFDIAVLHRLSRRDAIPFDLMILRPGQDCIRGEFRAVIRNDHSGLAAPFDKCRQFPRDATPRDRGVGDRGQATDRMVNGACIASHREVARRTGLSATALRVVRQRFDASGAGC